MATKKNKPTVYRSFADLKEISTVSPEHKAQIAAMERGFDDLIIYGEKSHKKVNKDDWSKF